MAPSFSRAESLRRYFLTLQVGDRHDLMTVRDVRAVGIMRSMQDMQLEKSASATSMFSLSGAVQRRNLKGYGQWLAASPLSKPSLLEHGPTAAQLTQVDCPPELILSKRAAEASTRLEEKVHVDYESTLHVPCGNFQDDKEAGRFVADLLALAPLVSGKDGSKPLHSCAYFTVASFAASLLLRALIRSYNQAAARHRAAGKVGQCSAAVILENHEPSLNVLCSKGPLHKLVQLLSCKAGSERVRWEMQCAQAILRAMQAPTSVSGEGKEYHPVELHSQERNCHEGKPPPLDRYDGLWSLLDLRCRHGTEGGFGEGVCVQQGEMAGKDDEWGGVMGLMCSAPLLHARLHKNLFERAWSDAFMECICAALIAKLEGKESKKMTSKGKELGLSMEDGRFGNGRSIFNTYADFETRHVHDPLVHGHDDEWSQTGRIVEAQRSIDAKIGMQLPGDEMSGGINGSIYFSMAALEKKLEGKIPRPVYPEMCARKISARCEGVARSSETVPRAAPSPNMSFLDALRKSNAENLASASTVSKPAWTKASGFWQAACRPESETAAWPARDGLERQHTSKDEASMCGSPQDPGLLSTHSDARMDAGGSKPMPLPPVPSAWGQPKVWSTPGQCSAAQAAQTASGILFAQTPETAMMRISDAASECPARAAAHDVDVCHLAEGTSATAHESSSKKAWGGQRGGGQSRVRYNPLRPHHVWLPLGNETRCATAKLLHTEIQDFLSRVEATEASRRDRDEIVEQVEAAVRSCWPEAVVEVYGSFSTDVFLPHSDVDLLVVNSQPCKGKSAIKLVSERLRDMNCCRYMKAIENASVPVVKLTADVTKLSWHTKMVAEQMECDVQHEEERSCIAVDVTLDCHIGDAPIRLRDFVRAQLERFPIIRPMVLVLKHFLFEQGLNDAYKGGLSSHSVILLLIFYFNIPEVSAAYEAGQEEGNAGYMEAQYWYGEWLLRVMQWLSEFPFNDVGIAVDPMSYVPLTEYGFGMLTKGECDPELPDVDAQTGKPAAKPNVLHIEDPLNSGNIAKGCFEWWLVRRSLQGAYRILANYQGPPPLARIFGGVPQRRSPLASIFDRQDVASSADEVVKSAKRRMGVC